MARGLAAAGAHIVVAARNADEAEAAVAALGGESTFIGLDVADERLHRGRGTEGSNPPSSSGESATNRAAAGLRPAKPTGGLRRGRIVRFAIDFTSGGIA